MQGFWNLPQDHPCGDLDLQILPTTMIIKVNLIKKLKKENSLNYLKDFAVESSINSKIWVENAAFVGTLGTIYPGNTKHPMGDMLMESLLGIMELAKLWRSQLKSLPIIMDTFISSSALTTMLVRILTKTVLTSKLGLFDSQILFCSF